MTNQILPEVLEKYEEIHILETNTENGNDSIIINDPSVHGHPVFSPQTTLNILSTM